MSVRCSTTERIIGMKRGNGRECTLRCTACGVYCIFRGEHDVHQFSFAGHTDQHIIGDAGVSVPVPPPVRFHLKKGFWQWSLQLLLHATVTLLALPTFYLYVSANEILWFTYVPIFVATHFGLWYLGKRMRKKFDS